MTRAMISILSNVGSAWTLVPMTPSYLTAAKYLFENVRQFKLSIRGRYVYGRLDRTLYIGREPEEYIEDFREVEEWLKTQ